MLDNETRRRIDTARDILVGKVPDPKSQVEQITIALIYKFMDDMDATSEELGGERSFFAGDFAKYGWAKLMAPQLGGFEVLNLYAEAITRMDENAGVPQLFRNIFKNAYLPYRDPETLKSFLKIIDEFDYDHSERLGDAFEYLLSVLGSQGDAGQFRTPRHIIDFMVQIIDPQKQETILDPACGTAGFLISSYKHILQQNMNSRPGDQLTPDERTRLAQNIKGYDISPDMVRLSLVNLYLHGFNQPDIDEYDTLTSEERWNDYADVILANPPFMSPKGGIKPHKRFSVQSKRSEVLFVDYIAEHLTPGGRAAIIVPEGVIFQSQNAYKQLRKLLVDDYLFGVVSLPAGVFQPYSGVKTSILLLDRALARRSDNVLFVKIEQDGFDLGAQRRPIDKNDLPAALHAIRAYAESVCSGDEFDAELYEHVRAVARNVICETNDWNLSGDRYIPQNHDSSKYELTTLSDISENLDARRVPIAKSERLSGPFPYYGASGIVDYVNEYIFDEELLLISEDGANLLSRTTPIAFSAKGKFWVNNHAHVLRFRNIVTQKFIELLLSFMDISKYVTGAAQPKLSQSSLNKIEFPLPPLDIQREIVAEIESYQRVIDGARAVVEHYRPQIPIDPDWEMVALGEVDIEIIDGDRGKNYPKSEDYLSDGYCVFLNTKNVLSNGFNFDNVVYITQERDELLRKGKLRRHDIVLTTRGTIGNVGLFSNDIPYENIRINSGMLIFRPNTNVLLPNYIFWLFQTDLIQQKFVAISSGSAQPQLPIRDLCHIEIPVPSLSCQNAIVAQIEHEQALVNANAELITLFEAKIRAKIASIWQE